MRTLFFNRLFIPHLLCFVLIQFNLPAALRASEPITLNFATNTEPIGLRGLAEKRFVEEIERLGKDKIQVNVYWQQSYLIDKEILEGVKDGTVDMGHVNINYYPNRLLLNSGIALLQQGPDDYAARMDVYERIYNEVPELNAEFETYNQKIIYTYSVLPLAACFTSPATSLKDFKDRRIRTASRWLLKMLNGTGAIPVSIPWADCYLALKTNALEGVYTNLDAIHRVKLDQVAPHILIFKELWNPIPFHITMNLTRWNRLSEDVQKIITAAAENARRQFPLQYVSIFDEIISTQKDAGIKVAFATKKDIDQWLGMEEIENVKSQWAKEVNLVKGIGNARGILKKIERIVADAMKKDL